MREDERASQDQIRLADKNTKKIKHQSLALVMKCVVGEGADPRPGQIAKGTQVEGKEQDERPPPFEAEPRRRTRSKTNIPASSSFNRVCIISFLSDQPL